MPWSFSPNYNRNKFTSKFGLMQRQTYSGLHAVRNRNDRVHRKQVCFKNDGDQDLLGELIKDDVQDKCLNHVKSPCSGKQNYDSQNIVDMLSIAELHSQAYKNKINPFSNFIDSPNSKSIFQVNQEIKQPNFINPLEMQFKQDEQINKNKDIFLGKDSSLVQQQYQSNDSNNPPKFFDMKKPSTLTKLVCFSINRKNGRYIEYSHKHKTCISIYICDGCSKRFICSSALGGHLSKCSFKARHFDMINKRKRTAKAQKQLIQVKEQYVSAEVSIKSHSSDKIYESSSQKVKIENCDHIVQNESSSRQRVLKIKMIQKQLKFQDQSRRQPNRESKSRASDFLKDISK